MDQRTAQQVADAQWFAASGAKDAGYEPRGEHDPLLAESAALVAALLYGPEPAVALAPFATPSPFPWL